MVAFFLDLKKINELSHVESLNDLDDLELNCPKAKGPDTTGGHEWSRDSATGAVSTAPGQSAL